MTTSPTSVILIIFSRPDFMEKTLDEWELDKKLDISSCYCWDGAQKSTYLKPFRVDLCAVAVRKEHKSHHCCLRMSWSTVWPAVKTVGRVRLQKKRLTKPLCPALKCQLSRPLASEAEGCFGSPQVEVRRLCAGQVCDYVSGVVFSTGGRGLLAAPFVWVMRLESQKFWSQWDKQTKRHFKTVKRFFNKGFNVWVTFDPLKRKWL